MSKYVHEYPIGTYVIRYEKDYGSGHHYETVSNVYTKQEREALSRTRDIQRTQKDIVYYSELLAQAKARLAKLTGE